VIDRIMPDQQTLRANPDLRLAFFAIFFICGMILQIAHFPTQLIQPQLFSEDGAHIYVDALQYPFWKTWLSPLYIPGQPPEGYILLIQRIAGSIATLAPPYFGPLTLYLVAYGLHVLCAMYILSDRFSELIASLATRSAIALFLLLLPTMGSWRGSIMGSIQFMIIPVIALIAAAPKPTNSKTTIRDCLMLLICALSCPSTVLLAPLFVFRFVHDRDQHSRAILATVILGASVQLAAFLLSPRPGESDFKHLTDLGAWDLLTYYSNITALRVAGGAFLFGTHGVRDVVSGARGITLAAFYALLYGLLLAVVLLALRIPTRLRVPLLYLIFVPHIAGIFFYATKAGFNLDLLLYEPAGQILPNGERYFFAGIAAIGIVSLYFLAHAGLLRVVAITLGAMLAAAVMQDYRVEPRPDYGYYNWAPQAACLKGLRDATRGTCWLTFYGGGWNGWKRSVTAPINVAKLGPLGTTNLADSDFGWDGPSDSLVLNGWAADPRGPMYPAAVFGSIEGVGEFRQFIQYNRIDIWEKLGGKERMDDLHTLGFKIAVPKALIAGRLKAGGPVIVRLKIVAFDLSGYYTPPFFFRINTDWSVIKVDVPQEIEADTKPQ